MDRDRKVICVLAVVIAVLTIGFIITLTVSIVQATTIQNVKDVIEYTIKDKSVCEKYPSRCENPKLELTAPTTFDISTFSRPLMVFWHNF